jgi:hypothetical protein
VTYLISDRDTTELPSTLAYYQEQHISTFQFAEQKQAIQSSTAARGKTSVVLQTSTAQTTSKMLLRQLEVYGQRNAVHPDGGQHTKWQTPLHRDIKVALTHGSGSSEEQRRSKCTRSQKPSLKLRVSQPTARPTTPRPSSPTPIRRKRRRPSSISRRRPDLLYPKDLSGEQYYECLIPPQDYSEKHNKAHCFADARRGVRLCSWEDNEKRPIVPRRAHRRMIIVQYSDSSQASSLSDGHCSIVPRQPHFRQAPKGHEDPQITL